MSARLENTSPPVAVLQQQQGERMGVIWERRGAFVFASSHLGPDGWVSDPPVPQNGSWREASELWAMYWTRVRPERKE